MLLARFWDSFFCVNFVNICWLYVVNAGTVSSRIDVKQNKHHNVITLTSCFHVQINEDVIVFCN